MIDRAIKIVEQAFHDKIISTPHIGAATNEAQGRIGDEIVKIIIDNFK